MKKLGEFLIEQGLITPENLNKVLALQQALRKAGQSHEKTYLGQILVKRNLINTQQLTQILSEQASQKESHESSFLKNHSQTSEKETAENDLLGAIESFSSKKKNTTAKVHEASTVLPNSSPTKKEEQNRYTQKLWKEFEVEEKKRYAVLKTLGEGGMGIVELVRDQLLGREVARKTIKTQHKGTNKLSRREEMLLWRFKKEADITALLEHPHIIPLYEMQRPEQGEIQFTMRKVEGQTLRSLLQKKRKGELNVDETQILSIFRKVCDAIAYAHSKGVIHRDLKPDNVMVGQFGEVYVMDWGIAKLLEENSEEEKEIESLFTQHEEKEELYKTVGGMGTPGYMSPEQQENASNVTLQSDIYSLGKILRECFTLYSSLEELKQRTQKKLNIESAKKRKTSEKTIPEEIESIEKKATQEAPEKRYKSVQEFIQDLEKYQQNLKVSAKEYGLVETLSKWFKRNQQKVIVGSLLASMAVGFPLYFWVQNKQVRSNNAQKAFQKAEESEKRARTVQTSHQKVQLKEKIKYFLRAFEQIDAALSLTPENLTMEEFKRKIGEELVMLTCISEDYQLASHIAENLQKLSLSILSEENKKKLIEYVNTEENKLLETHKQRFKELSVALLNPEEGEREIALVEIAQMGEEEIFTQILEQVNEGTQYFLKNEKRNNKKDEYYQFFATTLGNTNTDNQKTSKLILSFLNQFCDQKLPLVQNQANKKLDSLFDVAELQYMVNLAQSLSNLKIVEMREPLQNIRLKLGEDGSFWTQTIPSYKRLASLEKKEAIPGDAVSFYHQGHIELAKGDIETAILDFTEAIRLRPDYVKAYNDRGFAKANKGDFKAAILDFTEAIRLNPNNPEAYTNLGIIKQTQGDLNGAILDFTEAIRLNPQYATAYNGMGSAKQKKGDIEGAILNFTEAIHLNPNNSVFLSNRGASKEKKGDIEGAILDFTEAIRLNPNNPLAYANLGSMKKIKGDIQGAILDFTEVIRLNPNYPTAYNNRGMIRETQGDIKGAILDYDEALRLDPNYSEAYNNRGVAKFKNDFEGAILDFTEAIRIHPNYAIAYNNRGNLKQAQGDIKGAIADFTEAIRIHPNYSEAYNSRGIANFKRDLDKSIEDFSEALRLNPDFSDAYYNRGIARFKKKAQEGAKQDFQQYLDLTKNQNSQVIQGNYQQIFKFFPELAPQKK